jgi:pimeloyl-ACP methyl ester carboxylesterase
MRFLPPAAIAAALLAPSLALAQIPTSIAGDWYGTLDAGPQKLPVVFHIQPDGSATMESPAQMARALPATATLKDGKLRFELQVAPVGFDGALSADGKTLVGAWTQGGASLPLSLNRTAPVLNRPQNPKPPFPYREEQLSYRNPASGLMLAGTLTLPEGKGPFPAVILISGSGTQDRDETVFGHKPFLVLADALTRQGVAVLRVDDRGAGGSQASPGSPPTLSAQTTDVAAGVALLRARADIDPDRVGLIGHSEGGEIAPLVAAQDPRVAFLVLMSAPGVKGVDLLATQNRAILAANGMPEDQIEILLKNQLERWRTARDAVSETAARVELNALSDRQGLAPDSPQRRQILTLASPVWREMLAADPAPALAKIKVPVLAIGGTKDLQVDAKINLAAIKAALPAGGDVTLREMPGLNHLLQTANTGLMSEYGQIEETIAPSALSTIVDWTVAHASKTR